MKTAVVSDRGQITLPASVRRELGLDPDTRLEVEVRDREIVLRPLTSISDLAGVFHKYSIGKTTDWNEIREQTMQIVAEEIAHEGL